MSTGFQRRPRVGDAKSLWNFCTSPGWTKQEIQTLQLCLMKYGVGQWGAIVETGLLPGKVVGQLNSQTQRVLGQQSLASFSGLKIDVERVYQDNILKKGVVRKNGLIIHAGNTLSPEEKEKLRVEMAQKYVLSEEQMKEVEDKLGRMKAARHSVHKSSELHDNLSILLNTETNKLTRLEKMSLLSKLRGALKSLVLRCKTEESTTVSANTPHQTEKVDQDTSKKRKTNITQVESQYPTRKRTRRQKNSKKAEDLLSEETGEYAEPLETAIETILDLGYSRRHAIDALNESNNDTEAAIQWLLHNCN